MDKKPVKSDLTRREFLKRAGIAAGGVLASSVACGRTGPEPPAPADVAAPTAVMQPTAVPATATTVPTAVPPTATSLPPTATPLATDLAADTVLLGGKIITVDGADTIAQAVAIKDGLLQAVGTDEEIRALMGEGTRVLDLQGKTVTPGLIDPHNHVQVLGQLQGFYVPLMPPEVRTIDDMRQRLAEVVAQTPEGEWIQAYFLVVSEGRLPNRHDLDPVSQRHPLWIIQQGGHYGSANSLALEIAGITADTPDPTGGVIERDEAGEPTGVFYNHRAMDMLRRVAPMATPAMVQENIRYALPIFAAAGVTTYHDNNVRGVDTVSSYFDVDRAGDALLRGSIYYTLEWPGDVERALNEIERYEGELMRFAGFKFLLDGQLHMAYCHEPHNGVRWDVPTWEPQTFKNAVRALHDTGLQICVHCAGDAAADLTLDAYEEAMNANPRPDPRHRIEHAIFTTPESTQRMKDLGIVVSTQPQFIRLGGDTYEPMFGEARARRAICTREWLEGGVALALGSDAPTTPWVTPQITLFGAVRRISLSGEVIGPDQALTIEEALRAHTMGSAYAGHKEHIKGSIEPGKLADLAVWSEDPITAPLQQLWQIPMAMTIVGGKVVYET
ncbi:MAG TPA: amidohydrolase [Anaerolineae bacterium]|nr:amidohydrolase [Anaerolineae bacterium]